MSNPGHGDEGRTREGVHLTADGAPTAEDHGGRLHTPGHEGAAAPWGALGPSLLGMIEYHKLKDEQIKRIEFRDTMIHVHLFAVGGVASWTIEKAKDYESFLIIPWVCFILGWTYLINDDRITAIGRYIRRDLAGRLRQRLADGPGAPAFDWEVAHRSDKDRASRRRWQFLVDLVTFVFSGLVAIGAFVALTLSAGETLPRLLWGLVGVETLMMLALGYKFLALSDFESGE